MNDSAGSRNKTIRRPQFEPPVVESVLANTTPNSLDEFLDANALEAYKRPWHRLERGLRKNRVQLFAQQQAEKLQLSKEDTDSLRTLLLRLLERKVLNSKSVVVYDIEKESIQEIKGLYYQRVGGHVKADWSEKKVVGSGTRRRGAGAAATSIITVLDTPAPAEQGGT
jgi:hypothetical protein